VPFFQGVGGAGAVPFAMITEPSLCAATAVLSPMAPTNTNMVKNTNASLRDIVPPGMGKTPDALYPRNAGKASFPRPGAVKNV